MLPLLAALLSLTPPPPARDTSLLIPDHSRIAITSLHQPIHITGRDSRRLHVSGAAVTVRGQSVTIAALAGDDAAPPIMIALPRDARVSVSALAGAVTVDAAPLDLHIDAFDGHVAVSGGQGEVHVASLGGITIRNFNGTRLALNGLAGPIDVSHATGVIRIQNVDGPITLRDIRSADVEVSQTDGGIVWIGDFDPEGHYRFENHDGGIELRVPRSFDARLRLTSFDGGLRTDLPATISHGAPRREGWLAELQTTAVWRNGRATIMITTFDGGVTVRPLD